MSAFPNTIYLDNAATTRCSPTVIRAVSMALEQSYGNPSSAHPAGAEAAELLQRARETLGEALGARRSRIVFTSGGTEANNLAVLGTARAHREKHLLAVATEHDSVRKPLERLATEGFELEWVPVDEGGRFQPEELLGRIRRETALVCMMHGNNEIGTLHPIHQMAKEIHERNPRAFVHVDAVQSLGWESIEFDTWEIDGLAVSAHKIHGPKGVGALVVREGRVLQPQMLGGGQQGGLRSGTENLPGMVGFMTALQELDVGATRGPVQELRAQLRDGIARSVPEARFQTPLEQSLPHILSVLFPGVTGEVLLHHLEEQGIFVSTGSACHAVGKETSPVLRAIGLDGADAGSTIRFSLSRETTRGDIQHVLERLPKIVSDLRALEA